jgi:hypothetical protein
MLSQLAILFRVFTLANGGETPKNRQNCCTIRHPSARIISPAPAGITVFTYTRKPKRHIHVPITMRVDLSSFLSRNCSAKIMSPDPLTIKDYPTSAFWVDTEIDPTPANDRLSFGYNHWAVLLHWRRK